MGVTLSEKMKRIWVVFILVFCCGQAAAQKATFEILAPHMVVAGEVFSIEYSLNAKPEGFTPPDLSAFNVIAGPSTSTGSSVSIINGSVTKSYNYTYTYVISIPAPGIYTLPGASVTVEGKTVAAASRKVEAIDPGADRQAQPQGQTQQGQSQAQQGRQDGPASAAAVADDDILLKVRVDKTKVFKGQPVRVMLNLYTKVFIAGKGNYKAPTFNGFWTQDITPQNLRVGQEAINGKLYEVVTERDFLVYPQQSGKLTIDPASLDVIGQIVVRTRARNPIDEMLGGGQRVEEVRRTLKSAPVTIEVSDLPAGAPESFSGAVGRFTLEEEAPSSRVSANSAFTYAVKVTGTGNLPLIRAPKVDFPSSFEQYNIKSTESLSNSPSGISGYRRFEYPVIARAEGLYNLQPVEFTYFNPETMKYVTLSTPAAQITVLPDSTGRSSQGGMVTGLSKEEIKVLGRDIRFIKIGKAGLSPEGRMLMGSGLYYGLLAGMAALFLGLYYGMRRRRERMSNVVFVRGKRANKIALQRLRTAEGHMRTNDHRGFYEEMLKAMWGYMSDKLNIPVANLTKENIREELSKRGIAPNTATRFTDIISECEYAQYSPGGAGRPEDIYRDVAGLISQIESKL